MCNLNHLQKVDYEEVEQGKYFNQNGSRNDDIHQGVQSIPLGSRKLLNALDERVEIG
jgi:hypothetical protein